MIEPYFSDGTVTLYLGKVEDVLPTLPDASVDAVVTDPPYGLEFMGKDWDSFGIKGKQPKIGLPDGSKFRQNLGTPSFTGSGNPACRNCGGDKYRNGPRKCACAEPNFGNPAADQMRAFQAWCEVWATECLRILKPGGFLLAFGGTRTYHRLVCAIEDAGFEIRDSINCSKGMLAWYYGSGFPKSRAVSRDSAFCQCLPDVRGASTEEAAESAARLLLQDLRRAGQTDAAHISDLHGLPVTIHPDYAVPGGAEQDVLADVRGEGDQCCTTSRRASPATEDGNGVLHGVRHAVRATAGVGEASEVADMLPPVQREGSRASFRGTRPQGAGGLVGGISGALAGEDARPVEPGLEGRGDVQAAEGQLHRPEVRPMPARSSSDGPIGRLHHGTSAGDGPLDRTPIAADGGRESHRPESSEQRSGESGVVSVERGSQARRGWPICGGCGKPQVPAGLGTALKPAWEPIVVARRPPVGTVAANALTYGTGALNIDGCRLAPTRESRERVGEGSQERRYTDKGGTNFAALPGTRGGDPAGRWPTNVLFSHPPIVNDAGEPIGDACADGCVPGCPVAELDRQSGELRSGSQKRGIGLSGSPVYGAGRDDWAPDRGYTDVGGASRFFPVFRYEAKANSAERPRLADGTAHSTVKPLALMRWLVRLVTPPGGTVLDPFAGSGTTGEACAIEGFRSLLIEQGPAHAELIKTRLAKPMQAVLGFEEPG